MPIGDVFGVASLTLNPTSGSIGSTVIASGSGFSGSSFVTHYSQPFSPLGESLSPRVRVQQFTGLPSGATITQIGLVLTNLGTSQTPHVRIKLYLDNAGAPNTLLAESGSILVTSLTQNFTISAIVPSNGIVWAGAETDSDITLRVCGTCTGALAYGTQGIVHTYGTGPDPIGATVVLDQFSESLTYTTKPLSMKWDGTLLSTIPSPIIESTTGSFSGVKFTAPSGILGIHTVNATETGGTFATATFTTLVSVNSFNLTGYVLANNGIFNNPSIIITNPSNGNITKLTLWNLNGQMISSKDFSSNPIPITANVTTTIPVALQDNTHPTGSQTYYEQAIIKTTGNISNIVTSNQITLSYGTIVTGNLNFNFTNTNVVPIYFVRNDLNTTDTRLSVIYPNTMSILCNLNYTFAMTNKTYGPPLANVPFDSSNSNSSFKFHNLQNEIVNVLCTDSITKTNAKYVLTQNSFPFQQQIQNLRNGTYGTHGQIGILDFVTIGIIIISMIGFNRVNETVGVIFSISIIGACAFFGLIALPTFITGAITIGVLLAVLSTRKTGGF